MRCPRCEREIVELRFKAGGIHYRPDSDGLNVRAVWEAMHESRGGELLVACVVSTEQADDILTQWRKDRRAKLRVL